MIPHRAWGLPLVWLDFETFYDTASEYTLSKMTTEEYVRDPRFQAIGLCAVLEDGQTLTAKGPEQTRALVHALQLTGRCVVAHNAFFDSLILSLHYGIIPGAVQCTLDMARPHMPAGQSLSLAALVQLFNLGAKGFEVVAADGKRFEDFTPAEITQYIDGYCVKDTRLCRDLHMRLYTDFYATESGHQELEVLSETILCSISPNYQFDAAILAEEVARLKKLDDEREARLLAAFNVDQAALRKFLGSGKRLAQFIDAYAKGVGAELPEGATSFVPMKVSPTDNTKITYAFAKTDDGFLALMDEDSDTYIDEFLADVVIARIGLKSSIRMARTSRLLAIAQRGPYGWPITWRGAGNTGRWAALRAEKINSQNHPLERDPKKPQEAIRRAIKGAPAIIGGALEPMVLVSADSSSIEARMVVTAAGQEDMRQMYEVGADLYCHQATQIYQREITKADVIERQLGKGTVLGCGFAAGPNTLHTQMRRAKVKVPLSLVELAVQTYRKNNAHIPQAWRDWDTPLKAIEKGRAIAGDVLQFGPEQTGTNAGHRMFITQFMDATSFRVLLPSGRWLYYRDLRWEYIKSKDKEGWTYMGREERPDGRVVASRVALYGAKLFQNWVQATSCDAIAYAVWNMKKRFARTLAGNAHDELTYIVPVSQASECKAQLLECMRMRPAWMPNLPLNAEAGVGFSYADV